MGLGCDEMNGEKRKRLLGGNKITWVSGRLSLPPKPNSLLLSGLEMLFRLTTCNFNTWEIHWT